MAKKRSHKKSYPIEQNSKNDSEQAVEVAHLHTMPPKVADVLMWTFVAFVALFFLVIKSYSFHWEIGDENVYFYMTWATLDHGAIFFRDYFFAHPPLHLLPGLPVFYLFGFTPWSVRLIPVSATVLSAFFLMQIARKNIGRVAAVASVFVILTSFSLLRASTHWTGINLAVMWISLGLFFLFKKKPAVAGAMFALGVCTGNYVLPGAVMAALLSALESRRSLMRFFAGFAIPWAIVQAAGLLIGAGAYIDGVYRYHFLKPTKQGVSRQMFYRVATDNFLLHLGALLAPLLAWLDDWFVRPLRVNNAQSTSEKSDRTDRVWFFIALWNWLRRVLLLDGSKGLARIGALWALGYLFFIAIIPRVFPFYFLLAFPGLALAAAYTIDRLSVYGVVLAKTFRKRFGGWNRSLAVYLGLIVLIAGAFFLRIPIQRSLLPHYNRSRPVPMVWSDSALPVNSFMRWCCWDDVAQPNTSYGTIQEVLYHESRYFEQAGVLAKWLKEHSRQNQTLFGDSSTAGLIAILASRRLESDFADTNTMRFISGISKAKQVIEQIDTKSLGFVIARQSRFRDSTGKIKTRFGKFASLREFRKWLDEKFQVVYRSRDRTKGTFVILGRKNETLAHSSK